MYYKSSIDLNLEKTDAGGGWCSSYFKLITILVFFFSSGFELSWWKNSLFYFKTKEWGKIPIRVGSINTPRLFLATGRGVELLPGPAGRRWAGRRGTAGKREEKERYFKGAERRSVWWNEMWSVPSLSPQARKRFIKLVRREVGPASMH